MGRYADDEYMDLLVEIDECPFSLTQWELQFVEDVMEHPERLRSVRVQETIDGLYDKYVLRNVD